MRRICLLLIFVFTFNSLLYSQNNVVNTKKRILVEANEDSIKSVLNDYDRIQLPPLSAFLATAADHPSAKIYQSKVDEADAEYQIVKYSWLDYLKAVGNYQYGYNNYLSNFYNEDDPIYSRSQRAEHKYSVGATVSIPIGNLVSQKHKRRAQKAKLDQLRYEYEMTLEERKLTILQAYNTVVEQLSTIKVKSESAALYNAQMKISEDDFANGKIDIIQLSLERQRRSNAMSVYQEAKVSLHNAITLLELLTNISIMKK